MCVCVGILGWPRLTLWPGSTFTSSTLDGGGAILVYQLSNYSLEFLNLTFYNASEQIANVSTEVDVVCDDPKCELATVRWQVPAEGLYHMCYSFSSVVTQNDVFSPNCTEVTRVVANKCKSYSFYLSILLLSSVVFSFSTAGEDSCSSSYGSGCDSSDCGLCDTLCVL